MAQPERTTALMYMRRAVEGTPFAVTETPVGFDVRLDVADVGWWTPAHRHGLRKVFTHEVALGDDGSAQITDVALDVEWRAGLDGRQVPTFHRSARVQRGRIRQRARRIELGVGDDGRLGTPVNYSFEASDGRRLVEGCLRDNGWTVRRGLEEKIGLAAAAVALGGIVVGAVTVLVVWLLR